MRFLKTAFALLALSGAVAGLQGCMVIAVADAAVTTAATVAKTGVKATGAVIDAVIPDSKDAGK